MYDKKTLRQHYEPQVRKSAILDAAVNHAEDVGYQNMTLKSVADAANCSTGLVIRYFTKMALLRSAVMHEAVRNDVLAVVAQGLAAKDSIACGAPIEIRNAALASLTT